MPKHRIAQGVDHEGIWVIVNGRTPIRSEETREIIGATNRFRYRFRNKGERTGLEWSNWFLREYRLFYPLRGTISKQVFCKITENLC
ncbi:hypothetical protein Bca52824_007467 [Brassica carinata]|uniref:NAC domain-containing protein n=1 Tax=Brassica carinata TaxID=52824 RepID=A0A8X7W7Z5_BRACI|nr:hypothetical protein Bca52824_007467 [Brassica carinata]